MSSVGYYKKVFLLLLATIFCDNCFAESIFVQPFMRPKMEGNKKMDKSFDLVLGVNAGYYVNGEVGIARSSWYSCSDKYHIPPDSRISYRLTCE